MGKRGGNKAARRSLADYEARREFSRTPEPTGDEATRRQRKRGDAPDAPFFCVQKHLASHLHYDFRLEHRGVLLSWAVPKGPSLNPADKRLAMQTEDHPLDYGEFEGVIPEGYGAGIVLLWDRGTWTPEPGFEDIDKALEKGELKFRLDGYKLKGSWVLVRTRGWGGRGRSNDAGVSRSWLLIKHRDEWAGELDVASAAPLSIKTERDFADVLASEDPGIWESHRPAKSGETGRMFQRIIKQAIEIKGRNTATSPRSTPKRGARRKTTAKRTTKARRSAARSR